MRSSQLFFLLVLPFQMQISVSGQPSADCFVQGKCTESLYLHIKPKLQRELECLEHCGTVGGSSYFTYDSETEVLVTDCLCGKNPLKQSVTGRTVSAGKIVKSWAFLCAPLASLVMSLVSNKSVLSPMLGKCFKWVTAADIQRTSHVLYQNQWSRGIFGYCHWCSWVCRGVQSCWGLQLVHFWQWGPSLCPHKKQRVRVYLQYLYIWAHWLHSAGTLRYGYAGCP